MTLLSYDGPPRSFAGRFDDVPFAEAMERLLKPDSYAFGVRSAPGAAPRVVWLRVLGDPEAARRRASARAPAERRGLQVVPSLLQAAFGSDDPAEREAALERIVQGIPNDPAEIEAFLAADAELMAAAIRRYPHVTKTLAGLRDAPGHPALRASLAAVMTALGDAPSP